MSGHDLKALLYSLNVASLSFEKGCLINGSFHTDILQSLPPEKTGIVTPYYRSYQTFKAQGYVCETSIQDTKDYDLCCVLLPKQKDQALYDIASALTHLKEGGVLVLCAAKDAGGARLLKILKAFGLEYLDSFSKYHCKCVIARKVKVKTDQIKTCLHNGRMQINQHGYHVKAGVFGWNKIDGGSQILSHYLPSGLIGKGADFGCGYGYLTDQVLTKNPYIQHISCFDVDVHAVDSCQKNIQERHPTRSFDVIWMDLTQSLLTNTFDFIVMNPPFHEGKSQNLFLGQKLIQIAHKALKKQGILYMVANTHLPYEKLLKTSFSNVESLTQEKGFKIFKALK